MLCTAAIATHWCLHVGNTLFQFLKNIIPQIKPVLRPEARAVSLIKVCCCPVLFVVLSDFCVVHSLFCVGVHRALISTTRASC